MIPFHTTIFIVLCINKMRCLASSNLFWQWANLMIAPLQKNETMEAPQNRRFSFKVWSSFPLAQLYGWKEDNICQSMHGKVTIYCPSGILNSGQSTLHTKHNLQKKSPSSPTPATRQKGRPLHCMTRLLIGCMEILFLKLAATIFGLDK